MTKPLELSASRTCPVPVERAFDIVMVAPLEQIFSRRFLAIPPISGVSGQEGTWATVGQTRTVRLADGGTMREELVSVDRPHSFGYRLGDVTGALKPLAGSVDGVWRFEPAGTGARITWAWTVHPASSAAGLVMPVLGFLWRGYARRALERIEEILLEA